MAKPLHDPRIFVITGAGISAESGIPTFRGAGGHWRERDAAQLATEAGFRADPQLVWEWYRERRACIRAAQPNAAHHAVVELAGQAHDFLLLTQNVDDLHSRARWNGRLLPPEKVVQIHGDIFVTRCTRCDFSRREPAHDTIGVPRCPQCGNMLRPGVVWFGENLPPRALERVGNFLSAGPCDFTLVIGTTALFGYIVEWARFAKGLTGDLIEINPEETPLSEFATKIVREPAAVAVPRLVAGLIG